MLQTGHAALHAYCKVYTIPYKCQIDFSWALYQYYFQVKKPELYLFNEWKAKRCNFCDPLPKKGA